MRRPALPYIWQSQTAPSSASETNDIVKDRLNLHLICILFSSLVERISQVNKAFARPHVALHLGPIFVRSRDGFDDQITVESGPILDLIHRRQSSMDLTKSQENERFSAHLICRNNRPQLEE